MNPGNGGAVSPSQPPDKTIYGVWEFAYVSRYAATTPEGVCQNYYNEYPGYWTKWWLEPDLNHHIQCRTSNESGFSGTTFPIFYCQIRPKPDEIVIAGPSSTKVLPAGPALKQVVRVSKEGAAVVGTGVSVSLANGATLNGTTNSSGEFHFSYVPGKQKQVDQIVASCGNCVVPARKTMTVEAGDTCDKVGNPILPATGEKEQSEVDWSEFSAHPLGFNRTYRSYAQRQDGLGVTWGHHYVASVSESATATTVMQQTVRFGDGSKVIFSRADTASAWVADNGKDALTTVPGGWAVTRAGDDSRWLIDAATNRLISITQRNGWVMTLAYNSLNQLAGVTNAFGRSLHLEYDTSSRLTRVNLPDRTAIRYAFDESVLNFVFEA